jgi:hypothetical protein
MGSFRGVHTWFPNLIAVLIAVPLISTFDAQVLASDAETHRAEVDACIAGLSDPRQEVRDTNAARIREVLAQDPAAARDPGKSYWKEKLKAATPGMTHDAFKKAFGGSSEGEYSGGGGSSALWRLDDYWVVEVYFKVPDSLISVGPLHRRARHFWTAPPSQFFSIASPPCLEPVGNVTNPIVGPSRRERLALSLHGIYPPLHEGGENNSRALAEGLSAATGRAPGR